MDPVYGVSAVDLVTWLFVVTNSGRVLAYLPQIRSAWKCENGAASISCATWGLFAVAHLSGVLYAAIVVGDLRMALVFTGNLAACVALVSVIVWKRHRFAALARVDLLRTTSWPLRTRESVLPDKEDSSRGQRDEQRGPTREAPMTHSNQHRGNAGGGLHANWRRLAVTATIATILLTGIVKVAAVVRHEDRTPVHEGVVARCDDESVMGAAAFAKAKPESSASAVRQERERRFNACIDDQWVSRH